MAMGHPFTAATDVHEVALDAIWSVVFGTSIDTIGSQLQSLLATETVDLPTSIDKEATFTHAPTPDAFNSIITLSDTLKVRSYSTI